MVIDDTIYSTLDRKNINITKKAAQYNDIMFPNLNMFRQQPVLIEDRLVSFFSNQFHSIKLDLDKINLHNETVIDLAEDLDFEPTRVATDLEVEYYINDALQDNNIETTVSKNKDSIVYKYLSNVVPANEIQQKITIGRNNVVPDKLITHCYKI
jgi:hypothetical protein